MPMSDTIKELHWIGSSKKDLMTMPDRVRRDFGHGLHLAQIGLKYEQAKPLKGFGSAGVLEIAGSGGGSIYRAVYTVKIGDAVYVLHCFQKKSKSGIATPKQDMELIRERLKEAESHAKESKNG